MIEVLVILGIVVCAFALAADARRNAREDEARKQADAEAEFARLLNK